MWQTEIANCGSFFALLHPPPPPRVRQTEFFVILGHFLPFLPNYWPQKLKFGKTVKKTPGDIILLHVYQKWRSNDVWFLRYGARQTEFFLILDHFLPFCPPKNPENQNFEKMKKTPGDTITLNKCIINDNHMMFSSWDMKCDRHIFFVILGHFLPLCPTSNPKNQNFEKMKKLPGDIIILHRCTKNHNHLLYCSWDTARDRCNLHFSFWAIFCSFTPLTARKIKISKKWTKLLEIPSFYTCVPKIMIRWCTVNEIWCATDGRTDGKNDKQRWVPHLKRARETSTPSPQ